MNGTVKVRDLLRGCEPGRLQSVGNMQVIPLLSDLADDRFVSPAQGARVSTASYGTLVFNNPQDKPMLVPSGATYIVAEEAQNHALPHAGYVAAHGVKQFPTAMCVQQTQGGYIREGEHRLMLLPFPLREKAHRVRREVDFRRLWPAISEFNRQAGLADAGSGGHLEYFFERFKDDLDTFVAQFEPVPRQVGAIVLIAAKVVGIERTPSPAYFRSVWRVLVRECYGSLAVLEARRGAAPAVPRTRVPLRRATSLADLRAALAEVEAEEYRRIAALVEGVLEVELRRQPDEAGDGLAIDALGEAAFVGQLVRDGERVVYASLVATEQWRKDEEWLQAEPFRMQTG
jgi:hypothetical protein